MDDLIAFLYARLDEDEQTARATEWCSGTKTFNGWDEHPADEDDYEVRSCGAAIARGMGPEFARHIARHDPARVLAEVKAKRRVIDNVVPRMKEMEDDIDGEWGVGEGPSERESITLLRLLALPYADHGHPDYRPEWRL